MRSIKVMLVDDNREFRMALREYFEMQESVGVVAEADDGAEAVEQAREVNPDLIVMDIAMPRMDGITATKKIKKESPGTAIVFVSAYDEEKFRRSAIDLGAEAFICKALLVKQLPRILKVLKERLNRAAILLRDGAKPSTSRKVGGKRRNGHGIGNDQ